MTQQSQTRKLSGSSSGPTLAQLKDFVDGLTIMGVDPSTQVRVERTPYYNQFDVGEWRLEATWSESQ